MNDGKIRGYSILQQASYLEQGLDEDARRKAKDGLPADVVAALPDVRSAEWYPRSLSIALLRAIADPQPDEQSAYQALVDCGRFIANEATNTYLKLLMRILTPSLFAKKVPDFWQRDQQGGRFEVDISKAEEGCMTMALRDVAGFDHIGIVSIGWILFGMETIGKQDVRVSQTGWSRETPGPSDIFYEIAW